MRGQAEGESIDDIASRIKKVYTEAGNRAKTIARTETGCAINSGAYQYYKAVEEVENVTVMKEWITAGDENVRDSHVMVDGETVHLDGVFANGLMYPNDPDGDASEVINCRCAYITVTELKG
jgi:SPP1 gp7 family putative phage head morphogenesis protein